MVYICLHSQSMTDLVYLGVDDVIFVTNSGHAPGLYKVVMLPCKKLSWKKKGTWPGVLMAEKNVKHLKKMYIHTDELML